MHSHALPRSDRLAGSLIYDANFHGHAALFNVLVLVGVAKYKNVSLSQKGGGIETPLFREICLHYPPIHRHRPHQGHPYHPLGSFQWLFVDRQPPAYFNSRQCSRGSLCEPLQGVALFGVEALSLCCFFIYTTSRHNILGQTRSSKLSQGGARWQISHLSVCPKTCFILP